MIVAKTLPDVFMAPSDVEEVAINPSFGGIVLVAVDQCNACGVLWRFYSNDTYSLVPGMTASACCDNVQMDVKRIFPRAASHLDLSFGASLADQELAALVRGDSLPVDMVNGSSIADRKLAALVRAGWTK